MREILEKFGNFFKRGKILYFPGCSTLVEIPHIAQNYEALLNSAGISFVKLNEVNCCGGHCLEGGYRDDFEKIREKNMALFREQQITKIITNDPSCYLIFKEHYSLPIEYAPIALTKAGYVPSKSRSETVFFHDECFLDHNDESMQNVRKMLEQKGFILSVPSMINSKCCGAGGLLPINNPLLAKNIAEKLVKAVNMKIITSSPLCYSHLKEAGADILELSEVLDS